MLLLSPRSAASWEVENLKERKKFVWVDFKDVDNVYLQNQRSKHITYFSTTDAAHPCKAHLASQPQLQSDPHPTHRHSDYTILLLFYLICQLYLNLYFSGFLSRSILQTTNVEYFFTIFFRFTIY